MSILATCTECLPGHTECLPGHTATRTLFLQEGLHQGLGCGVTAIIYCMIATWK